MPRVSDRHKQDRVSLLHRATWKVIARNGLDHVTLDDVVAASGYTVGMIYHYFPSRDALVTASIDRALDELQSTLSAATAAPTDTPEEFFLSAVRAFESKASTEPFAMATASMFVSSRPPLQDRHPVVGGIYEAFVEQVAAQAAHWMANGSLPSSEDGRDVSIFLVSIMWGYLMQQWVSTSPLLPAHLAGFRSLGNR